MVPGLASGAKKASLKHVNKYLVFICSMKLLSTSSSLELFSLPPLQSSTSSLLHFPLATAIIGLICACPFGPLRPFHIFQPKIKEKNVKKPTIDSI